MVVLNTIVRPYAIAAFQFACEHKDINHWQSMLEFSSKIICNKHMMRTLPKIISPNKLADFFLTMNKDNFNIYYQNLIRIMAYNNRLLILPIVLEYFKMLVMQHNSIMELNIISANPLKKDQLNKIVEVMSKSLLHKIRLTCKIDKSIIGGIIIYSNNMVIDASIRNRLNRLANFL